MEVKTSAQNSMRYENLSAKMYPLKNKAVRKVKPSKAWAK